MNRLRLQNAEPITVFIDSPGGAVTLAENLRALIKATNPNGDSCRIITVVTSMAASAAADFLALGDYSIAYSHTEILYHGTRSDGRVLTYEDITGLASSIQDTNEFFAVRLAECAFRRFALRITQLKKEFEEYRSSASPNISDIATAIRSRLSNSNKRLTREAMRRQKLIGELTSSVGAHLRRFKSKDKWSDSRFEAELLKAIINYKVRIHRSDNWLLSTKGLQEVVEDFRLLHDFHFGRQRNNMSWIVSSYGQFFLTNDQRAEFEKLPEDETKRNEWLIRTTEAKLRPLWYLVVSLCRLLQTDDFSLTAQEAYWLGLVDEVPGTGLPNLREIVENTPDDPSSE